MLAASGSFRQLVCTRASSAAPRGPQSCAENIKSCTVCTPKPQTHILSMLPRLVIDGGWNMATLTPWNGLQLKNDEVVATGHVGSQPLNVPKSFTGNAHTILPAVQAEPASSGPLDR